MVQESQTEAGIGQRPAGRPSDPTRQVTAAKGADGPDKIRRVGRRRAAGPSRDGLAANDDAPSIGGLIYALQQKPSQKPFIHAAIGTGIWALLSLMIAWVLLAPEVQSGASIGAIVSRPAFIAVLTVAAVPIALIWFLALLVWRAQELHMMSTAMTEVAVRLAEPDRLAEQSIASLGQSVRRQVSAMNDGISRAIGRAGELEVLVHNEVAALERSYEDNEQRVRALIEQLASERDAIANNSERVTEALRSVGNNITQEIETAGERAASALHKASASVADQISEKGNALYSGLQVMSQRIGQEIPTLVERLGQEQGRLTRILEGASKNLLALESALGERTGELDTTLNVRTQEIQNVLQDYSQSLNQRLEEVADALEYTNAQIEHAITERSQALDQALIDRTRAIDSAFSARMQDFDLAVAEGAQMLDDTIAQRANALRIAMESQAAALGQMLERQSTGIDETLVRGIDSVRRATETITTQSVQTINSLSAQAKFLKETSEELMREMSGLTTRFASEGQSIMKAANAIESSSSRIEGARTNSDIVRRALEDQLRALDALSGYSRRATGARDITPPDQAGLPSVASVVHHPRGTSAAQSQTRETWSLGDLLARASLEDEDGGRRAAPPQGYGPPDQPVARSRGGGFDLADIAQALDPDTAAAVWQRYRSGERGLFTRQLYTLEGQSTFDEISRRIHQDPGFRGMSERYLADFERLLREADMKDPSGRLVQNHLVAETGRVYLLLAHASGRLG